MYWDGCIVDGIKPNQGILLATNHPNSVIKMLDYVNKMKDSNGDDYNFLLKTWKEEGINYPN